MHSLQNEGLLIAGVNVGTRQMPGEFLVGKPGAREEKWLKVHSCEFAWTELPGIQDERRLEGCLATLRLCKHPGGRGGNKRKKYPVSGERVAESERAAPVMGRPSLGAGLVWLSLPM